jgi:hypothetical protein
VVDVAGVPVPGKLLLAGLDDGLTNTLELEEKSDKDKEELLESENLIKGEVLEVDITEDELLLLGLELGKLLELLE